MKLYLLTTSLCLSSLLFSTGGANAAGTGAVNAANCAKYKNMTVQQADELAHPIYVEAQRRINRRCWAYKLAPGGAGSEAAMNCMGRAVGGLVQEAEFIGNCVRHFGIQQK